MAPIQRTMHDVYPFISPASGLKDAAKGKTVLVTGGSRGIGRAIARSFALAGASKIYLVGRGMESLRHAMEHIQLALDERSADCSVVIIAADLMDETHVAKLFGQRMEKVPDVLVNNAGVLGSQKGVVDSEPGTWWRDWVSAASHFVGAGVRLVV